ncbi:metallophosphoesterase [Schaedlerella arabinosiphila]|uniref:Phosphoesterase n=1 Tax=Schaedlerella arabinosiphila TaxID=2044587 RepID=A0A3R8LC87_9FIRM|nr:metallophosphoesterase [Schaedlerella arabinosiphila]RRK30111.1 metallophosphoesterase [Schaedlerella arabinosiphila]
MRILIVSDTHGYHKNLDRALESAGEVDMFIHLGDVEGGEEYINAVVGCEKHVVRGNNDFFSDLPKEEEFYIGEKKVFITHGHAYCVSLDPQQIKEEGKARNADIVMFGHTHRPYLEQDGSITVLNPGSLSYPRQEGRKGSYMIMETKDQGEAEFHQLFL